MPTFEQFWQGLTANLKRGLQIRGWSKEHGHTDLRFTIIDASSMSVKVFSAGMKAPRNVSKGDAKKVWEHWQDYCAGKIGRAEMTQLSQNTSYIFGLIKWHEDR
jgi:hypothetical protein